MLERNVEFKKDLYHNYCKTSIMIVYARAVSGNPYPAREFVLAFARAFVLQ